MRRIFILIKCVYYLFPELLQERGGGARRLAPPLQDDTDCKSYPGERPVLLKRPLNDTYCEHAHFIRQKEVAVISSDGNSQNILGPQPDAKHIYDLCNATEGAESTQPFHFILLKLRLARFYELLHKSY